MRNTAFVEGVSGQLAERWIANLFSPAFVFWLGGGILALSKDGWQKGWQQGWTFLQTGSETQELVLLVLALLGVTASAFIVEKFDFLTLRILEGYWPRFLRKVRRWKIQQKHRHYDRLNDRCNQLLLKQYNSGLTPEEEEDLATWEAQLKRIPDNPRNLMPTRLGNCLRAVELRPMVKYGLDPVLCWPHLWLLLPEQARQDLSETRTELNLAVRVLIWGLLFILWSFLSYWAILISLIVVIGAYFWALSAAETYADLLEATFDLYRFDLYRALQLPLPQTPEAEQTFATQVNTYLARGYFPSSITYELSESSSDD